MSPEKIAWNAIFYTELNRKSGNLIIVHCLLIFRKFLSISLGANLTSNFNPFFSCNSLHCTLGSDWKISW
jgi:hypothetical protein